MEKTRIFVGFPGVLDAIFACYTKNDYVKITCKMYRRLRDFLIMHECVCIPEYTGVLYDCANKYLAECTFWKFHDNTYVIIHNGREYVFRITGMPREFAHLRDVQLTGYVARDWVQRKERETGRMLKVRLYQKN
jgi:hypothetical protein